MMVVGPTVVGLLVEACAFERGMVNPLIVVLASDSSSAPKYTTQKIYSCKHQVN